MRVVVVGGGFGGLQCVKHLRRAAVEITLVDRQNFHLFQPLVYQVATGALSAAEIATPLRAIFKRQQNVRVVLGLVTGVDLDARTVTVQHQPTGDAGQLPYDALVVSAGSRYSYFGHDDWRTFAPELKSLEGALDIRSRILGAFEAAEVEPDEERRRAWLTFVVVGGGPTGVEMAGQIGELARDTLRKDFRSIDPRAARVLLVETTEGLLTAFPRSLSRKAARSLRQLGVTVFLEQTVVDVTAESVSIATSDGTSRSEPARTAIWAAGVEASPLATVLSVAAGGDVDRAGRVTVEPDLSLPGHPEAFAIGDMVRVRDATGVAQTLPGLAPVAMQQGRYVARALRRRADGGRTKPFRYADKGNLATIGRLRAVADVKGLHLSGLVAWLTWLLVHLFYLIGFQNRLIVILRWTVSFVTHGRGARLITRGGDASESR